MPRALALELMRLRVADVQPTVRDDSWLVTSVRRIGGFRLGRDEVLISPKVPIRSLMFMLGFGEAQVAWRDESISADESDDFATVVATTLVRLTSAATRNGVMRGYRSVEVAEPTIRGRWDVSRQLRSRPGQPIPVELTYDDFTSDIPENRILLTALMRLLALGSLPQHVRNALLALRRIFVGVSEVSRGVAPPAVVISRLNRHYESALSLARLVLNDSSLEHELGGATGTGFLVTMSTLFEQFVSQTMRRAATSLNHDLALQDSSDLDVEGIVQIRPDLVLRRGGTVVGVADAKYKLEKPSGFPNADVYQALTYAVSHGLSEAHLVYAKGESPTGRIFVGSADVAIVRHALDLDLPPAALVRQVESLVEAMLETPQTRLTSALAALP